MKCTKRGDPSIFWVSFFFFLLFFLFFSSFFSFFFFFFFLDLWKLVNVTRLKPVVFLASARNPLWKVLAAGCALLVLGRRRRHRSAKKSRKRSPRVCIADTPYLKLIKGTSCFHRVVLPSRSSWLQWVVVFIFVFLSFFSCSLFSLARYVTRKTLAAFFSSTNNQAVYLRRWWSWWRCWCWWRWWCRWPYSLCSFHLGDCCCRRCCCTYRRSCGSSTCFILNSVLSNYIYLSIFYKCFISSFFYFV